MSSDMEDSRIKRPRDDEGGEGEPTDLPKRRRGEGPRIDLRILMQSKSAGAIIGKGGSNINRLRNDYKASVTVPDSNGPERVLSVGAELGTVLDLLLDVLPEMEDSRNKRVEGESELRMIVHQSQAGCIIGRSGSQVKDLREKTGATIKVFSTCCPNSTDRVVSISGKPKIVVGCIEAIVELLQQAPPKGHVNPYDPAFSDEFLAPEYGGFITGDTKASKGLPRGAAPPPSGLRAGGMRGGIGNMNANNMGIGRGGVGRAFGMGGGGGIQQDFSGDMVRPNIVGGQGLSFGIDDVETTQVTIPTDLAGAIIGKGGSRITDIRRASCAQIVIDEALPGSNDRIITISGTPDQIQNAQYLLQKSVKLNAGNKF